MKYDARKKVGYVRASAPDRSLALLALLAGIAALLITANTFAQALYKYKGENGEWIYSDRPPVDSEAVAEIRNLTPTSPRSGFRVDYEIVGESIQLVARTEFYAPVELKLDFQKIRGLEYPHPDDPLRWTLEPRSTTTLLTLGIVPASPQPIAQYRYEFLVGDPNARHRPTEPYRLPYAVASDFVVSQAYPDVVTHNTPDSQFAIDFAMPVGTDVFAARGGVVFDMVAGNFEGGTDASRHMSLANVVRILHDDGTYAIYAHLNWNSVRVRIGERVERGEYIADSGNTGFSSGPHLHFVVVRNSGMAMQSVPVQFAGPDQGAIAPASGMILTAY
jgi:murein DD-endopeptidase MepM/ murein hydrolase activator NlpD